MVTLVCDRKVTIGLFVVTIFALSLLLYSAIDHNLSMVMFMNGVMNNDEFFKNCTMKTNVFFLKVPKSASGTTMILLWRFVMAHKLNPLLTYNGAFSRPLSQMRLFDHPHGESYNVLANHMNFKINKNEIQNMMPNDTTYIGIVREPKSRFQSYLLWTDTYQKMRQRIPLPRKNITDGQLLLSIIQKNPERLQSFLNRQSHYFAIRADSFETDMEEVFNTFQLILIADYYDESLVLLKRYLCWDLKDIIYNKAHVQNYSVDQKTVMSNPVISAWFAKNNYIDFVFYEKCLDELRRKISNEGKSFQEEVRYFQNVLKRINIFCSSEGDKLLRIELSRWNNKFNITRSDCKNFNITTKWSRHLIKSYQQGRIKT